MRLLMSAFLSLALLSGCSDEGKSQPKPESQTLQVTASAYNAVADQTTQDHPTLTAWGDTLKPGMKAIAVSRDLISQGLDHGMHVHIEGLDGVYIVRDKMNQRWTQKIDIYMGDDVTAAQAWGVQTVTISWVPAKP